MEANNQTVYETDLYLRLSREDGDKAESDSIAGQRDLLLSFLERHPEIHLHEIRVDDGYSGVNFDRPDFIKMMESVKRREINCIIVKDFSRLGRNFIETCRYIEKLFPFMGVRFISVNDSYDSVEPKKSSDGLLVPVKNLMNDAYCRDTSIKIRSQLAIKRKKGECIAPFAAYGYLKSPENRHQLIIDEQAAGVVRDIFKRKLDGYSAQAIADWLNGQDTLSPMEYKRYLGSSFSSPFKRNAKSRWTAVAILRILKNPIYIGTLVQGKRSTPNYKIKKLMEVPKERWVVVENSHEPIVSRETFDNVAKILSADTRTSPNEEKVLPLSGLLYCGDCGRSMTRKNNASKEKPYYYYICSGSKQKTGCTSHSIRDRLLEDAVLCALQEHIRNILDLETTLQAIHDLPYTVREVKKTDERLAAKRAEIEKCQSHKLHLHEDYSDGIISREDYRAFGKRYDDKISEAESAVFRLEREIEQLAAGGAGEQKWIDYFKAHENIGELNRKLAVELIDRIEVFENQKIHIAFKFQAEFDRLSSFAEGVALSHPSEPSPAKEVG